MMNIQELSTIAHHNLDIKIFVLDNGGYLTIKQTQELGFQGRLMGVNDDTGLSVPNMAGVSEANGIWNVYAESPQYMPTAITLTLSRPGPALCELMLSPDQPQAPRSVNRRNPDGTMNPTKLEDSYPFLPPEIIEQEMQCALSL